MISLPLLKRNMAQTWKILLILLAAMTLYTTVIIYMYAPKLAHMLDDYQDALPGMMSAVGMTGIAGNLTAFMHIYLYGFIMLIFITAIGIGTCEGLFPGELDIPVYLKLNGALLLFHLILGGVAFLPACIFNDSKWYFSIGAGLLVLFFLFRMLGNMGGDLEFFRFLTPFTLFPGSDIVDGREGVLLRCLSMAGTAIVLYGGGIVSFHKKDLPL